MLRTLLKVPFAIFFALGIVLMIVCAIPFFVIGFISGFVKWTWQAGKTRKNGFTPITRVRSAWQGWTADQSAEAGRLPGSGSFVYNGALRAVAAARAYLRQANVDQVQIRTNQDRKVLVYNKCADGTITHYDARTQ